jgi:glycosyltransferase involved in cell wall biosynthesis
MNKMGLNILNIVPWGVYPPKTGGQIRTHCINLELSKIGYNICMFSQGLKEYEFKISKLHSWKTNINENYIEYRYVNLPELSIRALLNYLMSSPPIFTGTFLKLFNEKKILSKMIKNTNIIKIDTPWQFKYLYELNKEYGLPIVLDEHNVEYIRISQSIKNKYIQNTVWKKENFAIEHTDIVFAVSNEEKQMFNELYNVDKKKIWVIPSGVDISKYKFVNEVEKNKLKEKCGFKNKKIILFVGASYYPNIESVEFILKIVKEIEKINKNVLFIICGSVNKHFKNFKRNNVIFTGFVPDLSQYCAISDIAINPVIFGAGTNIKMFEYLASGLPVITTHFGARGIELENYKNAIIVNREEFIPAIVNLLNDDDLRTKLGINARKLAEEKYDWKTIAKKVDSICKKLV